MLWSSLLLLYCLWQVSEPSAAAVAQRYGKANNFATLRTTSMVTKEQRDLDQENMMKQQMSGFKQMRKAHLKQLRQVSLSLYVCLCLSLCLPVCHSVCLSVSVSNSLTDYVCGVVLSRSWTRKWSSLLIRWAFLNNSSMIIVLLNILSSFHVFIVIRLCLLLMTMAFVCPPHPDGIQMSYWDGRT